MEQPASDAANAATMRSMDERSMDVVVPTPEDTPVHTTEDTPVHTPWHCSVLTFPPGQ
jgi:hypothetical protein